MNLLQAGGITFVHARNESGDDYYLSIPGLPTDEEVEDVVAEYVGDDDAESTYVEYIDRVEIDPTGELRD